jgi:HEAT repeat protein
LNALTAHPLEVSLRLTLRALLVGALLFGAAPAYAGLNTQQREELNGYVQQLRAEKDPAAIQAALLTWASFADRKALPELEAFKTHEHPRVRLAAGLALMRAGDKKAEAFVLEQLMASTDLYATLRDMISLLPDKAEGQLLVALRKKSSPEQRRDVDRYLGSTRGSLFKILGDDLQAKDVAARQAAREAAMAARNTELLTFMPSMFKAKDDAIRLEAVQLAQQFAQQDSLRVEATKLLELGLADKSPAVKEAAARALTAQHHAGGAAQLIELARASEDNARKVELLTLVLDQVQFGVKPSLESVRPLLDKKNAPEVRVIAYQLAALSGDDKIADQLVDMFTGTDFDDRLLAAPALGYTRRVAVAPRLEAALVEGDARIRLGAAQGLGLIGQESSLTPLEKALSREREPSIRLAVVRSISQIKATRSLQVLRFQTSTQDVTLKLALIDAFVALGNPEAKASLEVLIKDRADQVRWRAWLALVKLSSADGLKLRKTMLANPPDDFMESLVMVEPATRASLLKELLAHQQPRVSGAVVARLLAYRSDNMALLHDALTTPEVPERVKRAILDQLGAGMTVADAPLLEQIIRNGAGTPDLARQAGWILARLGEPSLEASFRGLLGSKDVALRSAATYGLMLSQGG